MKTQAPRTTLLALALGLAVAGTAVAQQAPRARSDAQQQELEAARAQLDQAVQRYAELARKYGDGTIALDLGRDALFRKPVIGVVLAPATEGGVRIAGVTPGSAA